MSAKFCQPFFPVCSHCKWILHKNQSVTRNWSVFYYLPRFESIASVHLAVRGRSSSPRLSQMRCNFSLNLHNLSLIRWLSGRQIGFFFQFSNPDPRRTSGASGVPEFLTWWDLHSHFPSSIESFECLIKQLYATILAKHFYFSLMSTHVVCACWRRLPLVLSTLV